MPTSQALLKVEFHCHTFYSKDSLTSIESLLSTCQKKSIDRVVITDHNTIQGALEASRLDPQRVITGEEIMTSQGELLAAFVQDQIPPNLSPEETIQRLREQGAFISVSHPFDTLRSGSWQLTNLLRILPLVDAIETLNARCMSAIANARAVQFARQHQLSGTVGSDAHAAFELGAATLLLPPFQDAAGLKLALPHAQVSFKRSGWWVHLFSRYAATKKRAGG